jgi:sulfur transfer complex TusBCD TusB component (DsrH family)
MVVVFSDIRVDNAIAMTRLDSVLRSFAEAIEVCTCKRCVYLANVSSQLPPQTHKPKEKILFVLIGDFFARNKNVHVFPRVIRTPPKVRLLHSHHVF